MAQAAPVVQGSLPGLAGLFGLIGDIRVEAQNFQSVLDDIRRMSTLTDADARAREVAVAVRDGRRIFEHNCATVDERRQRLRALLDADAALYDYFGDRIAQIENLWERVCYQWPEESLKVDDILGRLTVLDDLLQRLVYACGQITIPERLNQHLRQLRVGQTLDFHETFVDELPSAEHRRALLNYLQVRPAAIAGVIDAEHGIIYRASPRPQRRLASYCLIVLAFVLGGLLVPVFANAGAWFGLERWPGTPERFGNLLAGYVFIMLGGFAHVLVDALKESRANRGSAFLALEHWLLWVHVNEVPNLTGLLSLWIGFLGLAYLQQPVQWETAFLVGYSIDSFTELFLLRFTTALPARTADLRAQLA